MANTANVKVCHYVEDEDVYITPKGRFSFVALARKFKSNKSKNKDDEGKYAVEINIPPEMNLDLLKKAANDAAQEKFGNKVDLWKPGKSQGVKSGFLKSDEKLADVTSKGEAADLTGYTMIRTTAYQRRPKVRDAQGNEIDTDEIETEAYSGRWGRLMVRPRGYENEGKGVTFYLEGVQLLGHDDKIGGGVPATGEGFGAVDDEDDDELG